MASYGANAAAERQHASRTLLILALAGLAFSLTQTTVLPAIPELMKGLHTDQSGVTWIVTASGQAARSSASLLATARAEAVPRTLTSAKAISAIDSVFQAAVKRLIGSCAAAAHSRSFWSPFSVSATPPREWKPMVTLAKHVRFHAQILIRIRA